MIIIKTKNKDIAINEAEIVYIEHDKKSSSRAEVYFKNGKEIVILSVQSVDYYNGTPNITQYEDKLAAKDEEINTLRKRIEKLEAERLYYYEGYRHSRLKTLQQFKEAIREDNIQKEYLQAVIDMDDVHAEEIYKQYEKNLSEENEIENKILKEKDL